MPCLAAFRKYRLLRCDRSCAIHGAQVGVKVAIYAYVLDGTVADLQTKQRWYAFDAYETKKNCPAYCDAFNNSPGVTKSYHNLHHYPKVEALQGEGDAMRRRSPILMY